MNAKDAIAQARAIIIAMKSGAISYSQAKEKCKPLFEIADNRGSEIAKRFGKSYSKINFVSFAR